MKLCTAFWTGFVRGLAKLGAVAVMVLEGTPDRISAEWREIDQWRWPPR